MRPDSRNIIDNYNNEYKIGDIRVYHRVNKHFSDCYIVEQLKSCGMFNNYWKSIDSQISFRDLSIEHQELYRTQNSWGLIINHNYVIDDETKVVK